MNKTNLRLVYPVGSGGQFLTYAISKGLKDNVAQYRFVPHEQGTNRWRYTPEWLTLPPGDKIQVDGSLFGPHEPWEHTKKETDYIVSITPKTTGELFWCLVNSRMKNLYNDDSDIEHKKIQLKKQYWYLSEFLIDPLENRPDVLSHDNEPNYAEYIERINEVGVDITFNYSYWFIEEWQRNFIANLGNDLDLEVDADEFVKTIKIYGKNQKKLYTKILDDIKLFTPE